MRTSAIVFLACVTCPFTSLGCTGGQAPDTSSGANISVTVAPLDLPLMTDACYGLSVFGTADILSMHEDTLVWKQPSLCASDYGAEGGIRFTGICDAQAGGFDENGSALDVDHNNTVMLVLNDIYTGGDWDGDGVALSEGQDYINPCPAVADGEDNDCILKVPCTANQDKKVLFNLTVMRDAQIGFFDTVVKFHDVFCAAKLDCLDDDNSTLTYLHNPDADPPGDGPTAVLGFACLGGAQDDNATQIYMYLDNLEITCATGTGDTYAVTRTATIDPSGGPGNLAAPDLDQTGSPNVLFGAAVNTGEGFQGMQFWNVLLGLNLPGVPGETCTLHTTGTVSEDPLNDNATPAATRYPYIDWTLDLTEDGNRSCTRHPLNGEEGGVATQYTALDAITSFDNALAFGVTCPCWDVAEIEVRAAAITAGGPGTYQWIRQNANEGFQTFELLGLGGEYDMMYLVAGELSSGMRMCALDSEAGVIADISEAELASCWVDILTFTDDPCAVANGGCSAPSVICVYEGPGISTCAECATDADCAGPPDGDVCKADGTCVECMSNADCETSAGGNLCDAGTNTCVQCNTDAECGDPASCGGTDTFCVCDVTSHACIEHVPVVALVGSNSGYGYCVLNDAGAVRCTHTVAPVLSGPAIAIAVGGTPEDEYPTDGRGCAVLAGGSIECWDRLGSVASVVGLSGPAATVGIGGRHACALLVSGAVECWGYNLHGALGDGTFVTPAPNNAVTASGLESGVVSLDVGGDHSCALLATGEARCWGRNLRGQLGDGNTTSTGLPVTVSIVSGAISRITASGHHAFDGANGATCVGLASGQEQCWGALMLAEGGYSNVLSPLDPEYASTPVGVDIGGSHMCAVLDTGAVQCWGSNGNRKLGAIPSVIASAAPVNVTGLSGSANAIATDLFSGCALLTSGVVQCWGSIVADAYTAQTMFGL